tara:strand:- start:787 stop:4131 length:3345 start_codon:yes stop_codon:yes gene_type:complete
MARYQSTVRGDTSQWIAGKVMSAAGMARDEAESQERDRQAGLNVANSGNLFGKALVSEFGGDFFARTIGTLNPNSDARKTDRAASKASRFAANFPRTKKQTEEAEEEVKKSNEDVDRAVDDLLANDDHIPVKDEKLREYVARVFGGGIDAKLALVDQRVSKSLNLLSDIRTSHQHSIDLMIDHNELIAGKLDKVLNLYQQQFEFQNILKDKSQVARAENQLELTRDLSRTRRYTGFGTGTETGQWIFGALSDIVGRKIANAVFDKLGLKKAANAIKSRLGVRGFGRRRLATATGEIIGGKNFRKILMRFGPEYAGAYLTRQLGKPRFKKYLETGLGRTSIRKHQKTILSPKGLARLDATLKSGIPEELLGDFGDAKILKDRAARAARAGQKSGVQQMINKGLISPELVKGMKGVSADIAPQMGLPPSISRKVPYLGSDVGSRVIQKKFASSAGKKATKKVATKAGAKALGKSSKFIPGVGTFIALGEAGYRFSQGDTTGGILSLLSAVPILGWGVTAVDIGRDLGFNPLGLPPPPDANDRLNYTASGGRIDQFEQGNPYGLTRRGDSMMHGTELIQAVDPKSGMTTSHIKNIGDTLVSTSVAMARDLRVDRDISNTVSSLPFAVRNIRYNTGIKTAPVKSRATTETYLERTDSLSAWAKEQFDKNRKKEEVEPEENNGEGGFQPIKMFGKWLQSFGGDGDHPNPTTITFTGKQGLDRSGEPGVDFSYGDYTKNYSLFDGTVVKTGHQSTNYGNVVIIRSTDPTNGKEFDALYAHFPDGGIKVKEGKKVRRGQYLGQVGFVSAPSGEPELQPNGAGRMSGYHTSVDFYEPDSTATYSNASFLTNLIIKSEGLSPKRNDLLGGIEQKDYTFEKEMIKEHEGLRLDAYYDNNDNLTIGYGHLIDEDSPVYGLKEGDVITQEKANELFEMDFKHHLEAAMNLPGWAEASERQRAALIDLVFNMGPYFLDAFPSMEEALKNGDFEEAARQLQFADPVNRPGVESKWMNDVGERRSSPILNLLRDNPIDYDESPHHNDIKDLQVNNNLQTEILSAINLMNDNRLLDDSKLFSQIEEDSNTLQIVMLNNTIVNNQTVKRKNNVIASNNNSLEMFKLAKLVG